MREANCKMITRKQKDSSGGAPQPRGCAFGWNQEKECWETRRTSPDDEEKNEIDNRSGEISQKKRQTERVLRERRREWFGVETKSQKGGYQSTVIKMPQPVAKVLETLYRILAFCLWFLLHSLSKLLAILIFQNLEEGRREVSLHPTDPQFEARKVVFPRSVSPFFQLVFWVLHTSIVV